jgi:hypothetical protein
MSLETYLDVRVGHDDMATSRPGFGSRTAGLHLRATRRSTICKSQDRVLSGLVWRVSTLSGLVVVAILSIRLRLHLASGSALARYAERAVVAALLGEGLSPWILG